MITVENSLDNGYRKVGYTLNNGVHVLVMAKGNWANYDTLFNVRMFDLDNNFVKEYETREFRALIRNCQLRHN